MEIKYGLNYASSIIQTDNLNKNIKESLFCKDLRWTLQRKIMNIKGFQQNFKKIYRSQYKQLAIDSSPKTIEELQDQDNIELYGSEEQIKNKNKKRYDMFIEIVHINFCNLQEILIVINQQEINLQSISFLNSPLLRLFSISAITPIKSIKSFQKTNFSKLGVLNIFSPDFQNKKSTYEAINISRIKFQSDYIHTMVCDYIPRRVVNFDIFDSNHSNMNCIAKVELKTVTTRIINKPLNSYVVGQINKIPWKNNIRSLRQCFQKRYYYKN